MANITYLSGNKTLIDKIRLLWEQLNKHHLRISPYFKDYYRTLAFEDRKRMILQRAWGGDVRVDLAMDSSVLVGYCVSSIDKWLTGEIDSIFIDPNYQGQGIGTTLMQKALQWLDSKGAKKKIISVAVGNEQAWEFYAQFGFLPRRTLLEQKKK
jgi:ribosomal protein S18 acetylase RimI-like enzyme